MPASSPASPDAPPGRSGQPLDGAGPAMMQGLLSRYSLGVRHLTEPGPSPEHLRLMAEAALHAPDHAGLAPYRFRVIAGPARERLATLFAQAARDAGKDGEAIEIEAERARSAPVTVAVVARIDLGHPVVPAHEQWAAVGGAIANFLNAAHALGFAGKMLSGNKVRHPALQAAFAGPGDTLVGWLVLGTAVRPPAAGHAKPGVDEVLGPWA